MWHTPLDPFKINKLTIAQIMNYVQGAMKRERTIYQINQPPMSDGKKWERQINRHMDSLWDMCYPKLKSYQEKMHKARKKRARQVKRKLDRINQRL